MINVDKTRYQKSIIVNTIFNNYYEPNLQSTFNNQ